MGAPLMRKPPQIADAAPPHSFEVNGEADYVGQINALFAQAVVQSKKDEYTSKLNDAGSSLSTFAGSIGLSPRIASFLDQLDPVSSEIFAIVRYAIENGKGIVFGLDLSNRQRALGVTRASVESATIPVIVRGSIKLFP